MSESLETNYSTKLGARIMMIVVMIGHFPSLSFSDNNFAQEMRISYEPNLIFERILKYFLDGSAFLPNIAVGKWKRNRHLMTRSGRLDINLGLISIFMDGPLKGLSPTSLICPRCKTRINHHTLQITKSDRIVINFRPSEVAQQTRKGMQRSESSLLI